MTTRPADGTPATASVSSPPLHVNSPGAPWVRPFVKLDRVWTAVETKLIVVVLLLAIFYMSGWVTLNAFHAKAGKLAKFPGIIVSLAGAASLLTWIASKERSAKRIVLPIILCVMGGLLFWASKKETYFYNVSRWLNDASLIRMVGTPPIVSSRLFTIWIALLGGSLATSAGRQINIDIVMRFIGPRSRLVVAVAGYAIATSACFMISWGFCDEIAITRYFARPDARPTEKLTSIRKGIAQHAFLFSRQVRLDARSFVHVVLKGEKYDSWYMGGAWNNEINTGGWANAYPPPSKTPPPAGAPAYPTKPCLSAAEMEELTSRGGSVNPDWALTSICSSSEGTSRPPLALGPPPDDRTPLEGDLGLLFPWGFLMIGCRFILRAILALGGAVSTDPNAAHSDGGSLPPPPLDEHKELTHATAPAGAPGTSATSVNTPDSTDSIKGGAS